MLAPPPSRSEIKARRRSANQAGHAYGRSLAAQWLLTITGPPTPLAAESHLQAALREREGTLRALGADELDVECWSRSCANAFREKIRVAMRPERPAGPRVKPGPRKAKVTTGLTIERDRHAAFARAEAERCRARAAESDDPGPWLEMAATWDAKGRAIAVP